MKSPFLGDGCHGAARRHGCNACSCGGDGEAPAAPRGGGGCRGWPGDGGRFGCAPLRMCRKELGGTRGIQGRNIKSREVVAATPGSVKR